MSVIPTLRGTVSCVRPCEDRPFRTEVVLSPCVGWEGGPGATVRFRGPPKTVPLKEGDRVAVVAFGPARECEDFSILGGPP